MADGVALRYEGLQNVVARLRADWSTEGLLTSPAILVNCHFDSVPLSPGASDDAVNCGIMLEVQPDGTFKTCEHNRLKKKNCYTYAVF